MLQGRCPINNQTQPETPLPAEQLTRLVNISLTLNSTLEPNALLQTIIQAAAELLNCEAVSIWCCCRLCNLSGAVFARPGLQDLFHLIQVCIQGSYPGGKWLAKKTQLFAYGLPGNALR